MIRSSLSRIRHLGADLAHADTRHDAIARIRHRSGAATARLRLGSGGDDMPAEGRTASSGRATGPTSRAWADAFARVVEGVTGARPRSPEPPDLDAAKAIAAEARRHRGEAELAAAIARGDDLASASLASIVALAGSGEWADWNAGWSLAEGLARLDGGAAASAMGRAVLLHRRQAFRRAWTAIGALDDATLAAAIPLEAIDGALATSVDDPAARDRAIAIAGHAGLMPGDMLPDLAGRFIAFGARATARSLVAEAARRPPGDLGEMARRRLEGLRPWLDDPAPPAADGRIRFGILADAAPEGMHSGGDVDDDIEALAAVAVLARFGSLRFGGDAGLAALATTLQASTRDDARVDGPAAGVDLVALDRSFTDGAALAGPTWLIATGDHVEPLYGLRTSFPYAETIHPLFVSFHVSHPEALTPDALDALRRDGPVGCRDWSTTWMLLGAGVDAFFSGALSTTLDAVFPARAAVHRRTGTVGLVDARRVPSRPARGTAHFAHDPAARLGRTPADRLAAVREDLAGYQRDLDRAVTERLQVALALSTLGVPTEYTPRSGGDVRLGGLLGLDAGTDALDQMRGTLSAQLASTLALVIEGATPDRVRAHWREVTRDAVAAARERFSAPAADHATTIDIDAAVRTSTAASRSYGPRPPEGGQAPAELVLAYDQNLVLPAAVLIESVVSRASGPVRVWILGRGLDEAYERWLAGAFPALPLTFIPCDRVSYDVGGPRRRIPSRITVSTMDRLLLPGLLPTVNRAVYLDVDTLVLDDICRLAATDLRGTAVAARDSTASEWGEWQRAGRALDEPAATEFRRTMAAQHGFGHPALNAGVLVMDLERMRRDGFTRRYLGLGERYALHDQDTMLAYTGPDRVALAPSWNAMPVLEDPEDPSIIHWASFPKPWDPPLTYAQDRWLEDARRLEARAGLPPGTDRGLPRGPVTATTLAPPA